MTALDPVPTRSALLELREEQALVREGFEFLDQKRMLLASEALRRLARHEELQDELRRALEHATACLAEAVAFHGLRDLEREHGDHPVPRVEVETSELLGVPIVEVSHGWSEELDEPRPDPSTPELRRCRAAFAELVPMLTELAAVEGNLHRLVAEYQRTERKARALEDVILPELTAALQRIGDRLEAEDLEEAVRVRLSRRR